jgi:uncharacterized protein YcfL
MKKLLILSIFLIILVACGTSEEENQGQIDDVVNLALEQATLPLRNVQQLFNLLITS